MLPAIEEVIEEVVKWYSLPSVPSALSSRSHAHTRRRGGVR